MEIVTNDNFSKIISSDKPVLMDFWAAWCGPCRVLSPIVDDVEAEMKDRVVVAKCNVDDAEDVAMECRIRNIPVLLFFKNGEVVDRTVGVVSKEEIISKLEALI